MDQLMEEPENIRTLEQTASDISQIFSVSSYHVSRRHFMKDLYQIRTVDASDIEVKKRHTPSTSFIQVQYPFSTNEELASNFVSVDKVNVRFGLILNEMDALATDVGYKYVRTRKAGVRDNFRIVSAVVDRMDFFSKIKANQDFKMNGYVMYVAKSSLVVGIDFYSKKNDNWEFLGNASYILAARTMDDKPYKVPQLSFKGELDLLKCKSRFEYGYHVQAESKAHKDASEYQHSPNDEEAEEIHNLLFSLHQQRQLNLEERRAFVPVEKTVNNSYILIQPQKNVFGDLASGGHILREAYELSYITCHLFCERQPFEFIGLDRLYYKLPVHLGSGYELTSKVTYSDEEYFRVNTSLSNIVKPEDFNDTDMEGLGPNTPQNAEFNFTFRFPEGMGKRKRIMPANYDDALVYLMNKRMLKKFLF